MLLNNFSTFERAVATKNFANVDAAVSAAGIGIPTNTAYGYYSTAVAGLYVDVGFGSTAVDKADYKLADSNAIDTTTLTHVSGLYLSTVPYIKAATSVYRNDTSSNVTVTEIGLCTKSGPASTIARNALIARKVLDAPVVIPPGETYAFTYSIEI